MTSKTNNKSIPISVIFKLSGIKIDQFSLKEPQKKFDQNKDSIVNYQINCTIPHKIINKNLLVLIKVIAIIIETEEILLEIQTGFQFEIDSINNKPLSQIKEIKLPEDLVTTFVSISISTIRGIIFERAKGTVLQNQLMPVVNPKNLIREFKEIKINPTKKKNKNQ